MFILTWCAEVHAHILCPCQQLISEVRVYLGDSWESIIQDVFKAFPKLKVAVLEQASIWFTSVLAAAIDAGVQLQLQAKHTA